MQGLCPCTPPGSVTLPGPLQSFKRAKKMGSVMLPGPLQSFKRAKKMGSVTLPGPLQNSLTQRTSFLNFGFGVHRSKRSTIFRNVSGSVSRLVKAANIFTMVSPRFFGSS